MCNLATAQKKDLLQKNKKNNSKHIIGFQFVTVGKCKWSLPSIRNVSIHGTLLLCVNSHLLVHELAYLQSFDSTCFITHSLNNTKGALFPLELHNPSGFLLQFHLTPPAVWVLSLFFSALISTPLNTEACPWRFCPQWVEEEQYLLI